MKTEITLSELNAIKAELSPLGKAMEIVESKIKRLEVVASHKESEWKRWATVFGLPTDLLGKTIVFCGRRYVIDGVNPGAPRFPIEAKRVPDSKPFRFPIETIKSAVKKKIAA